MRSSFTVRISYQAERLAKAARRGDCDTEASAIIALEALAEEADRADGRKYTFVVERPDGTKGEIRAKSMQAACAIMHAHYPAGARIREAA